MRLVMYSLILLILSGCAHCPEWDDCHVMSDSPKPETSLRECKDVQRLTNEVSSCIVQVAANQKETIVGLTVEGGEKYRVIVPCKQSWKDCNSQLVPLCGEKGSFKQNLFFWRKRASDSLWFSVIAEVIDDKHQLQAQYDLCEDHEFKISKPGTLILYPNDAEGFFSCENEFYDNNRGKIWLEIHRIKNG